MAMLKKKVMKVILFLYYINQYWNIRTISKKITTNNLLLQWILEEEIIMRNAKTIHQYESILLRCFLS